MVDDPLRASPILEGSLIVEGGVVIGCRIDDRLGLLDVDHHPVVMPLLWEVRRVGGDGIEVRTSPINRVGRRVANMDGFGGLLWLAAALLDDEEDLSDACRRVAVDSLDPIAFANAAATALRSTLDAIDPFVKGLDPRALAFFAHPRDMPAGTLSDPALYRALDRTIDPEAPLGEAWTARPRMRRTGIGALRGDPAALRHAARLGRPGIDALYLETLARSVGRRRARFILDVDDALDALDADRLAGLTCGGVFGPGWPGITPDDPDEDYDEFSDGLFDPPSVVSACLAALPGNWRPRDAEAWRAFVDCLPVVSDAVCGPGRERAAARIEAKGDWVGLRRRLCRALGASEADLLQGGGMAMALANAMLGLTDFVAAFTDQVIRPAMALAGRQDGVNRAVWIGHAVLCEGRSTRRVLEQSTRWHDRQHAMRAALPVSPEAVARTWPAGLPDFDHGGVAIRVLRSEAELIAEGMEGPDGDGVDGLVHCVGGYTFACLQGRSRILSLTSVTDGATRRLSTAEVGCGERLAILQHRGNRNGPPGPGAAAALARYMEALAGGALGVVNEDLAPVAGSSDVHQGAGYDFEVPGNWRGVAALWAGFLPRHLRGLDPVSFAVTLLHGDAWDSPPARRADGWDPGDG